MLRKSLDGSTEGYSTVKLSLSSQEIADLERYLDVTRGEMLFGRAVIMIEGDTGKSAARTMLAKLRCVDFEKLGITVCSVGGTNFEPYVRLLSADGLNVPFVVVTNGDPADDGDNAGVDRLRGLLAVITGTDDADNEEDDQVIALANAQGLFVGKHTFEIDLFNSGRHKSMCATLTELTKSGAAKKRADAWKADPAKLDPDRFIKDIKAIGKGRFAQRLATRIAGEIYSYISDAVTHLKELLS